jgi:uncharacterized protein YqeY
MAIQDELTQQMKTAMRARDARTLGVIRMIKSKMGQETTAYAKSQRKAIATYERAGEAGLAHIEQINWELDFLGQWLPKMADEGAVRGWVQEAIDGLGGKEKAVMGAVMGSVMKAHKGKADPNMVRKLVQTLLA